MLGAVRLPVPSTVALAAGVKLLSPLPGTVALVFVAFPRYAALLPDILPLPLPV